LFVNANGIVSVVSATTNSTNFTVNGRTSLSTSANWNFSGLFLRRTVSNTAIAKQISFLLDGDTDTDTTLTNYLNIWGTYSGAPTTGSTSTGLSASFNIGAPNQFIVHTNGSQRAAIDSSGRLLVGTSTSVTTGSTGPALVQIASSLPLAVRRNENTASASAIVLGKNRGSEGTFIIVQNNDQVGQIRFAASDGTDLETVAASITAEVDGIPGANDMPGRLVFSVTSNGAASPTERMRIDNAGNVSIGQSATTQPGNGNTTVGLSISPSGTIFASRFDTIAAVFNVNANASLISLRRSGLQVGSISVTTTATAYNTSSDYRLKENVTPASDGITRLQQLKPSRFNFIADPDTVVDGFLAHEVQTIVPEAITGEKDAVDDDGNPEYQGIDQSKLVPLLTAALQEAIAKIESIEARLTAAGL
jgi:hypothetical protein